MTSVKMSKVGETFVAYVDLGKPSMSPTANDSLQESPSSNMDDCHGPRLGQFEFGLFTVPRVLKFSTTGELNSGVNGVLYCTNFKLSYVPTKNVYELLDDQTRDSWPLAALDISLTNIESVEHLSGGKRKKLTPNALPTGPVEMIQVFCKDFRVFTFSFRLSPPEDVATALDYLAKRSVVSCVERLFGYEDSKTSREQPPGPYDTEREWTVEMDRCGASDLFRVTDINSKFCFSETLPRCFAIPSKMTDHKYEVEAKHYKDQRAAIWSYTLGKTHLLRGSSPDSLSKEGRVTSLFDCPRSDIEEIDIELSSPGLREIYQSYVRLMALCTPTNSQEFDEIDSHFLSKLEETRWLANVSLSLKEALKIAAVVQAQKKSFVVVREKTGVDMCSVICSLVQLILDPYSRTVEGFENLIRKEWVASGHPFAERLSHIRGMGVNSVPLEPAPMYLVFLDCVWQFLQQFPEAFQFSETYLTRMWDLSLVGLYDAFVLNNNKERCKAKESGSHHRELFDWTEWLNAQSLRLMRNPFYVLGKAQQADLSKMDYTLKSLEVWSQCYFRWIPRSEIANGDPGTLFMFYLRVAEDIEALQKQLKMPGDEDGGTLPFAGALAERSEEIPVGTVDSSYPFAPPGPVDCLASNNK